MKLLNKLYKLKRTLISDDNEVALSIIGDFIPLEIHRFKSGTQCYDWTIPKKWIVNKGVLKDLKGNTVIDFKTNTLHLVNYSNSYRGVVDQKTLLNNLHTDSNNPDAIPYRTSYYSDNWGFCLQHNKLNKLKNNQYLVDIDTKFIDGELLIGETILLLSPKSNK